MKIKINFDPIVYDDLPPEEKSVDELVYLVLKMTNGEIALIKNYSRREVEKVARQITINGLLRGTPLDNDKCVWSRLTSKGRRYLEILEDERKAKL